MGRVTLWAIEQVLARSYSSPGRQFGNVRSQAGKFDRELASLNSRCQAQFDQSKKAAPAYLNQNRPSLHRIKGLVKEI
jgi:hypothetical protein